MPHTSLSLLERLQDRDRPDNESWARMVDLYTPLIRGWLRRHSMTGPDADDVVQEILSVVFRRLPGFQKNERTGSFRAWLRTITVNCLRDFWKARRRRKASAGVGAGTDEMQLMLDQLADPASGFNAAGVGSRITRQPARPGRSVRQAHAGNRSASTFPAQSPGIFRCTFRPVRTRSACRRFP